MHWLIYGYFPVKSYRNSGCLKFSQSIFYESLVGSSYFFVLTSDLLFLSLYFLVPISNLGVSISKLKQRNKKRHLNLWGGGVRTRVCLCVKIMGRRRNRTREIFAESAVIDIYVGSIIW